MQQLSPATYDNHQARPTQFSDVKYDNVVPDPSSSKAQSPSDAASDVYIGPSSPRQPRLVPATYDNADPKAQRSVAGDNSVTADSSTTPQVRESTTSDTYIVMSETAVPLGTESQATGKKL